MNNNVFISIVSFYKTKFTLYYHTHLVFVLNLILYSLICSHRHIDFNKILKIISIFCIQNVACYCICNRAHITKEVAQTAFKCFLHVGHHIRLNKFSRICFHISDDILLKFPANILHSEMIVSRISTIIKFANEF